MKSKSILPLLLAMVLVFSLLPVTPAQAEGTKYDFMVGGIPVTSDNAADILGDGLFSYDAETNTLTVKGSKTFSTNAIVNDNDGLTIYVENDATLKTTGSNTLLSYRNFTITGPGKLTLQVEGEDLSAVFMHHVGTMTLEDANVRITGMDYGINGNNKLKLVVRNSFLTAGGKYGGIARLAGFVVEGCKLIDPYNGKIADSGVLAPEDAYETYAAQARIDPIRYDLWIAGTQVAEVNKDNILVTGGFSYNPETKTLTVTESCATGENVIVNNIVGLTIYVAKDVVLDSGGAAITTGKDLRITGPGKLGLLGNYGVYAMYDATVRLQDASVSAVGTYAITGGYSGTNKLIIQNSNLVATGITKAVSGFKGGIELIDCNLTAPEGGKTDSGAIADKSGNAATSVTISKTAGSTESVKTPEPVKSVAITVDAPAAGETPEDAVPTVSTAGVTLYAYDWIDENGKTMSKKYGAFEAGKSYKLVVVVSSTKPFDGSATATVNGETAQAEQQWDDYNLRITAELPVGKAPAADEVQILISIVDKVDLSKVKISLTTDKGTTETSGSTVTKTLNATKGSEIEVRAEVKDGCKFTRWRITDFDTGDSYDVTEQTYKLKADKKLIIGAYFDSEYPWSNASSWALEELVKANDLKLIPELLINADLTENITRREFAHVAVKLYEKLTGKAAAAAGNNPFADTDDAEVLKAYSIGITNGTSATTFTPDALIDREQMATMMTRALTNAGIDTKVDLDTVQKFADDGLMHDWGRSSIYYMSGIGIIKGVGNNTFDVLGNASREQSLLIAERSAEKLAK